jgi:type IX secretion system substrate protein
MAAIYFDFNEPIFTNEVSFTINDTPVAVSERPGKAGKLLLIFPNPAEREFTISSNGQLHGSGTMTLQNETGQILLQRAVEDLSMPIAVQPGYLPAGIYFVQLSGGAGVMAGKIVIQADRE